VNVVVQSTTGTCLFANRTALEYWGLNFEDVMVANYADVVGLRSTCPEVDWHRFTVWAREQRWVWAETRIAGGRDNATANAR
jgi:PAS domain-containing protein